MNDIEVLEELIKNEHGELLNCWDYGEEAKQAIENLLKERQSDKERIKELEEKTEVTEWKLEHAYHTGWNACEIISIPKSLIKEKIKELEFAIAFCGNEDRMKRLILQKEVLEELLKGE